MARMKKQKFVLFVSFAELRVTKQVPRSLSEIQVALAKIYPENVKDVDAEG